MSAARAHACGSVTLGAMLPRLPRVMLRHEVLNAPIPQEFEKNARLGIKAP
jgi:hypothetical protein